jgi:hypothetical protein
MTPFTKSRHSRQVGLRRIDAAPRRGALAIEEPSNAGILWVLLFLCIAFYACLPAIARSQSQSSSPSASAIADRPDSGPPEQAYIRPTQKTKLNNFLFDAIGPYPIAGAAISAGIDQWSNAPPEWNQGVEGYSKRFGSDFGISAVAVTTRYGLSEALKEDTMYYRCECRGVLPRLSHAAISTLTARRGRDGQRVFSFPALIAPYAGTTTAIYSWYPNRYGFKDAFRTGNYSLLAYVGENVSLEFFYSGPHSLLSRLHLNNAHGSTVEGPNK